LGVKKKITHEDFLLALEMEREEREEDIWWQRSKNFVSFL
jgi:hypothetical protein